MANVTDTEKISQNRKLVESFYIAFAQSKADEMVRCYHPGAEFEDPAFGKLDYAHLRLMWQLLCRNSRDFKLQYEIKSVDTHEAKVHWQAGYFYGKQQRPVQNRVRTHIQFKDGKIYRHRDYFSLWRWAGQAMGLNGWLVGWSGFFGKHFRQQSRDMLDRLLDRQQQKKQTDRRTEE